MGSFFRKLFVRKEEKSTPIAGEETPHFSKEQTTEKKSSVLNEHNSSQIQKKTVHQELNVSIKPNEENSRDLNLRNYQYPTLELVGQNSVFLSPLINYNFDLPIIWAVNGQSIMVKDLADLKAILITGTQSTGKSTFLHQTILSLLYKKHPSQLKLIFADIKGIEFSSYRKLDRHFIAKLPGEENSIIESPTQLLITLNSICIEIDNRYDLLKDANVRNIKEYNIKYVSRVLNPQKGHQYLPFIVVIIDDLGGFLSVEGNIEAPLNKLINEGYRLGVFLIVGTSQFGGRLLPSSLVSSVGQKVVFNLNSKEDYRRFFDTVRVKTHLTQGEFLFNQGSKIEIGRTALFEFDDIDKVIDFISAQKGYPQAFLLPEYEHESTVMEFDLSDKDSLLEDAARLIVQNQIGSTSLLQRRMKLGYNRAGRLMEQLEAVGIVGPNRGASARDVLIKTENELEVHLRNVL